MQNLKQIGETPDDMSELDDLDIEWDNDQLARNIRQVFTASHPQGRIIVGDFKAVESRGLAYLARAEWKLEAFRQGKDMYKVLATKFFPGLAYDAVTKPQRTAGKVGELSCGYGAGGGAVQSFAEGMGVELTEAEAGQIVRDWRLSNPEVVILWEQLNDLLHEAVIASVSRSMLLPDGLVLGFRPIATPSSLVKLHPGAQSIEMVVHANGQPFLKRYFHGCYVRGSNIGYYKPTERKTGDLWKNHFVDPKTKQVRFYELYGGKLAGILTQSFCRELFMKCLLEVDKWANTYSNLLVVGQFHDEIAVDWRPDSGLSLERAKSDLDMLMSDPGVVRSFPLAADIKDDYRYTK
jgi:DNA polymerase